MLRLRYCCKKIKAKRIEYKYKKLLRKRGIALYIGDYEAEKYFKIQIDELRFKYKDFFKVIFDEIPLRKTQIF